MRYFSQSWNSVPDRYGVRACITVIFFFLISKKHILGLHRWFLVQELEKPLRFPEGLGERSIFCYC